MIIKYSSENLSALLALNNDLHASIRINLTLDLNEPARFRSWVEIICTNPQLQGLISSRLLDLTFKSILLFSRFTYRGLLHRAIRHPRN